jgi:hypothetical protein
MAASGRVAAVRILLTHSPTFANCQTEFKEAKYATLLTAVKYNQLEVVQLLVEEFGLELKTGDLNSECLLTAASEGNTNVVNYLLDRCGESFDSTALFHALRSAVSYDHAQVVSMILRKCNQSLDVHTDNDFLLRDAASRGQERVVKVLLSFGADVSAQSFEAISLASQGGYVATVNSLIEHFRQGVVAADQDLVGVRRRTSLNHGMVYKWKMLAKCKEIWRASTKLIKSGTDLPSLYTDGEIPTVL